MDISQLQTILQSTSKSLNAFIEPLNLTFAKYQIDTPLRQAAFMSQVAVESAGLTIFVENLNYSKEGLLKVFGKYFNASNVDTYVRKPEKIANKVYANRMGNGDESSGDGWRYRGSGAIQLTGKTNQSTFAKAINKPLDQLHDYLVSPIGAIDSAGWFWKTNNLNSAADKDDIVKVTKLVNGGINGLGERTIYYKRAKKILL